MTSPNQTDKALLLLAHCYGIQTRYQDGTGATRVVPLESLQSFLTSMGVSVSSLKSIREAVRAVKARIWRQLVDDVLVFHPSPKQPVLSVSIPLGTFTLERVFLAWTLACEKRILLRRSHRASSFPVMGTKLIHGLLYVRLAIRLPAKLPLGYYRLTMTATVGPRIIEGTSLIIMAPHRCYLPHDLKRWWGISLQLYSLRSKKNWGVGDFRDLRTVVRFAGKELGADMVGVNPLHALPSGMKSPYSPSSRLFYHPWYLDIEGIDEFRHSSWVQRRWRSPAFQKPLSSFRESLFVQHEDVQNMKGAMLESLYRVFQRRHWNRSSVRDRAFKRYIHQGGERLEQFGVFQSLAESFHSSVWRQWPMEFQDPRSQAVERFRGAHEDRIRFFQYVQWQCELQLKEINRSAGMAKLSLGLYQDLPVGVSPDGADAWIFQHQLALGFVIGAPPDAFNTQGQNWGILAPNPFRLRAQGYQFFIETIRQNMRHDGVLRIDHVWGLSRLFLIPEGESGEKGTYVQYSIKELQAILALESVRQRVMVVGEDLGTGTPAIRKQLAKGGILSYRLLLFEKQQNGSFRRPSQYPQQALVTGTTHDLPTLRGFWSGRDIELKEQAGLYPSHDQAQREWEQRAQERLALLQALKREKLLPFSLSCGIPLTLTDELCHAIYQYLARTPCHLLAIPLEDLLSEFDTPNLPGVSSSIYPSWCRKVRIPIESWKQISAIRQFVATMQDRPQGSV